MMIDFWTKQVWDKWVCLGNNPRQREKTITALESITDRRPVFRDSSTSLGACPMGFDFSLQAILPIAV